MNMHPRTAALMALGIISAGSVLNAEEAPMNPIETALTSTTISGYVSSSAFFNLIDNDGGAQLPGRSFDGADKINQINLDVVKLSLERPITEGDWSAGYKVDLLFGPDANVYGTSSAPLGDSTSDIAIKQAYVALQTPIGNGLIAKVGVFDTIVGYEVFESGNNPNYSRSYGYFLEPTQHTGLLLSYAVTDWLTINAGIADSYNSRINAPGAEGVWDHDNNPATADVPNTKNFGLQTYMGSVAITVPESAGFMQGTSFYGGVVHGLTSNGSDNNPRTLLYAGLTVPTPVEGLGVGIAYDYLCSEGFDAAGAERSAWATAIGAYVSYQIKEQMKVSARGEYATGSAGTWTGDITPMTKEEFFGLTATLDYNLWENVLTRLEFRWDTDLSNGGQAFGSANEPDKNAYILGMNIIYNF